MKEKEGAACDNIIIKPLRFIMYKNDSFRNNIHTSSIIILLYGVRMIFSFTGMEKPCMTVCPSNDELVCGERVTLTVSIDSSLIDDFEYQWIEEGHDIQHDDGYTGEKSQNLEIISFSLYRHKKKYSCRVTRNGCSIQSEELHLTGSQS